MDKWIKNTAVRPRTILHIDVWMTKGVQLHRQSIHRHVAVTKTA